MPMPTVQLWLFISALLLSCLAVTFLAVKSLPDAF